MPPRGGGHHAKAIKAKRRQQQEECKRKKEEEQQQQVDRYMTEYDKDGSGVLDKEEFTALLKAVFASYADAINGDVIDKLIKSCESQGGITKENISRVTRKYAAYLKEMAAAATARESIFNRFDTDGDGTISKQEMLPILKLCAKMIKGVPENEVRNARALRCRPALLSLRSTVPTAVPY
jgi:Ca2+-binding EF-hand superfamily protein